MPDHSSAAAVLARLDEQPVRHLIDGRLVGSSEMLHVVNPATGEPAAVCVSAGRELLDEAVAAARRAQPAWAACSYQQRRAALAAFARLLRDNKQELGGLITLEQGKPLRFAIDEIVRSAAVLERLIAIPIENEIVRDDEQEWVEVQYRPLGVVGAITPWNVPIGLAVHKIGHALYTGNAIVLKPSPYTPLATLRMGEMALGSFPPGILNILAGGDALGRWMSEHEGIDKISFTGSIPTGRKVMASAAGNLKRLTLELGGNDASILLDDVDLAAIAPRLFGAAFINSGQVCMAIKRLYVHDSGYEEACERLGALARAARVGDGFDPASELGPVQNRAQHEIVSGILADTHARGARIVAGGNILPGAGYFVEPTVVADIAEGARLVDEEPFGPVLPVIRYRDPEEAVARANATGFGLAASVWSGDVNRASEFASRIEAGSVWVNRHVGIDELAPFGGLKQSGLGRQFGKAGLLSYLEPVSIFRPAMPR
jgi:acyl-CoA reductase-like NAD-dependent aldehyde dehydrogenase